MGLRTNLKWRIFAEKILSYVCCAIVVLTLLWRDWIEVVFGIDPDRGSGVLEWAIIVGLLACRAGFAALARVDLHRLTPKQTQLCQSASRRL